MKKVKRNDNNSIELNIKNEILGLIFLFLSIFLIFSLISYSPNDPSFFNSIKTKLIHNYSGKIGAEVSALLFNIFGYSSFIFILITIMLTAHFLTNRMIKNIVSKTIGFVLLIISTSGFLSSIAKYILIDNIRIKSGGALGYFLSTILELELKKFITIFLFIILIAVSLMLILKFSIKDTFIKLNNILKKYLRILVKFIIERIEERKRKKRAEKIRKKYEIEEDDNKKDKKKERKKEVKKEESNKKEQPPKLLFEEEEEEIISKKKYTPPPLTYLDAPTKKSKIDFNELEEKREELSQRLKDFRIRGNINEYTPGPVITTYEFEPDIGVKIKDVKSLEEDLALAVKAQYVRIDRIHGKKAIGIEIPNKKREIIHLRELLESEEYKKFNSPLTIALGKTKSGEIYMEDLRSMPHLIIAGATGSGKSVTIHTVILSIIFKSSPDDVKFILIDPKRVELVIYSSLPHLLTPVVVNEKLAKNALDWAVYEMEERYKKLASLQVRDIEQFNKKLELLKHSENAEDYENIEKIPYIVIIIDELAELMMVSSREIEENVARIAQKARAVGIHLILATQRPSTDIITGTIKNNFKARIALAVPSKHDSRTIIDQIGAEKLLGKGDMLFLPPDSALVRRIHGSFVSEEEALRIVNYLSKLAKPKFNTQVVKPPQKKEKLSDTQSLDDLFFDAAELIITTGQASTSYLQRKLSIGYARASRLMDQLETKKVVSPPNSKNQREILMNLEELEDLTDEEEANEI